MNFKLGQYPITLDEILYHISKGRTHLSSLIVDKFAELEKQIMIEKARADKAEALLKLKD